MKTWHDDDRFWRAWAPMMFDERRWKNAPVEVDHILKLLKLKPGARILDLCCGPGRHTIELAARGFRVTGVDRTRTYLAAARKEAAKRKLDVEFVLADMRRFRRPRAYDAVINMFTAFGYFRNPAQDRRVAENMFASLRPGGSLLMELMGKEVLARIFQPSGWHRAPDDSFVLEERKVTDDWSWMDSHWYLIRRGRVREFNVSHRIYSAAELRGLLKSCGFRTTRAFGDLGGAPYDHAAKRMILVARKS